MLGLPFTGNSDKFNFYTGLNGATPRVGDSYTLNVTYSDNSTQVLTVTIGAVLNAFATGLSPQGTGVSLCPDPRSARRSSHQPRCVGRMNVVSDKVSPRG